MYAKSTSLRAITISHRWQNAVRNADMSIHDTRRNAQNHDQTVLLSQAMLSKDTALAIRYWKM
jgi:hypothetical protein